MEGEWNEVKAKKKPKKQVVQQSMTTYGGKGAGGRLIAGPIKNGQMSSNKPTGSLNNQASTIADYDFGIDDDNHFEEVKLETVSHTCAQAVSEARTSAGLTQTQLAAKCGIKASMLVDIENGTAHYNAGMINDIEKALGTKIPRGRKKGKKY